MKACRCITHPRNVIGPFTNPGNSLDDFFTIVHYHTWGYLILANELLCRGYRTFAANAIGRLIFCGSHIMRKSIARARESFLYKSPQPKDSQLSTTSHIHRWLRPWLFIDAFARCRIFVERSYDLCHLNERVGVVSVSIRCVMRSCGNELRGFFSNFFTLPFNSP